MKTTYPQGGAPGVRGGKISHLLLAAALLLTAAPAFMAQTDFGNVEIIVIKQTAPAGTVDPGAGKPVIVTVTSERGEVRRCESNNDGRCPIGGLEPGVYEVRAGDENGSEPLAESLPSFSVRVYSGRTVTRSIAFGLVDVPVTDANKDAIKIVRREVVARAKADIEPDDGWLEDRTSPARLGVSGTTKTLEGIPNRNSEISTLFETQPGTLFTDGNNFGGVSFNGQPGSQNVQRLDGFDTTPHVLAPTSFQDTNSFLIFNPGKRQSFKELAAFSLDTNNTPANLGTGTGGKLLSDIKSGEKMTAENRIYSGEVYFFFVNDAVGARNFFDPVEKPSLSFNLFGAKLGGRLHNFRPQGEPQWFYFINYEAIRARSGTTLFEAAPSEAARTRAVASIAPLLGGFFAGGATIVPGASANPDFEILRLDADNEAARNAVTLRLDHTRGAHSLAFLYTRAHAREDTPEGVTGRRQLNRNVEQNAVLNYKRDIKKDVGVFKNEFIIGLNQTPSRLGARSPFAAGFGLSESVVGIGGEIARTDGERAASVAAPGGLLRSNSRLKGRGLLFSPTRFSVIDQLVWTRPSGSVFTFGGEYRSLKTGFDQLFGTTYNFANLNALLANTPLDVQFTGDLGSYGAATTGGASTGEREAEQKYYIAFAQHEFKPKPNMRLAYGLRYEYYSALREKNDRAVLFDVETGNLLPRGTPFYEASKNGFQPRFSFSWAPQIIENALDDINQNPIIFSASFGVYVGPGLTNDLIKPIESDRLQTTRPGGLFPLAPATLVSHFTDNPDDHSFQPSALARDYTTPTRVYKYDVSLKQDLLKRSSGKELFIVATYAGNRSRNLLLRNFTNRIIGVETAADPTRPAEITRQFDIRRDGQILHPFGEIEYRTSGGNARYNSLQLVLKGRFERLRLSLLDVQYTLASNRGNTYGAEKTVVAGNPFDYDYDSGFHIDDVRHNFTLTTVFDLACNRLSFCNAKENFLARNLLGNWSIGTIFNRQSGRPVDVRIKRPDVVYLDAENRVFNAPGAGRRAMINVPGGGNAFSSRRPDLVPGVSPYLDADRRFLNPAAFAIPAPGTLGNLPRGAIRSPSLKFLDLSVRKEFKRNVEKPEHVFSIRVDISNVFNMTNFDRPTALLSDALTAGADQLQPGQPYTASAAGSAFGILERTYKRDHDLGASRQIQFGFSFTF